MPKIKIVPDPPVGDLKTASRLFSEAEFAAFRCVKISALRNERSLGEGPAYERLGRKIFYALEEIEKYRAACTTKPKRVPTLIDGASPRRRKNGTK